MFLIESWKPIKGFELTYIVSEFGNVKRLGKNKPCKPYLRNGYLSVGLSKSNKVRSLHVHRLVAETFIPNPKNLPTVNHLNCIKTDNHVWNLEWCSRSEQIKHAVRMGVFNPIPPTKKGDKLSKETRKKMSIVRTGKTMSEITRQRISEGLKLYNENGK